MTAVSRPPRRGSSWPILPQSTATPTSQVRRPSAVRRAARARIARCPRQRMIGSVVAAVECFRQATFRRLQRNGCAVRTPYLVCPIGAARTSSAYGGASGGASGVASKPPPKNYGPLPKPPALSAGPITVDEAWALFGIPQKRGRKEDVKKRYLEFVFKHHPDKAKTKKQKDTASAQLTRANLAWSLLEKHCKW